MPSYEKEKFPPILHSPKKLRWELLEKIRVEGVVCSSERKKILSIKIDLFAKSDKLYVVHAHRSIRTQRERKKERKREKEREKERERERKREKERERERERERNPSRARTR